MRANILLDTLQLFNWTLLSRDYLGDDYLSKQIVLYQLLLNLVSNSFKFLGLENAEGILYNTTACIDDHKGVVNECDTNDCWIWWLGYTYKVFNASLLMILLDLRNCALSICPF